MLVFTSYLNDTTAKIFKEVNVARNSGSSCIDRKIVCFIVNPLHSQNEGGTGENFMMFKLLSKI